MRAAPPSQATSSRVIVAVVTTLALGCRATTWERADARQLRTTTADRVLVVTQDRAYELENVTIVGDSVRGMSTAMWLIERPQPILAANEGEPEELARRNHWRRASARTMEVVVPLSDVRYASRGEEEDSSTVILLMVAVGIVGGFLLLLGAANSD